MRPSYRAWGDAEVLCYILAGPYLASCKLYFGEGHFHLNLRLMKFGEPWVVEKVAFTSLSVSHLTGCWDAAPQRKTSCYPCVTCERTLTPRHLRRTAWLLRH